MEGKKNATGGGSFAMEAVASKNLAPGINHHFWGPTTVNNLSLPKPGTYTIAMKCKKCGEERPFQQTLTAVTESKDPIDFSGAVDKASASKTPKKAAAKRSIPPLSPFQED